MRPPRFEYYRPASVYEALQMLATYGNAKVLAGGHSLIPAMNLRLAQPEILIDLGRLDELRGISVSDHSLYIGALCTHTEVAASEPVNTYCSLVAAAAGQIGDVQVRNWGTMGGNLAHADPAADLPPAILACGGIIHAQSADGARAIQVDDFFIDLFTVDLLPGELIVGVELPISGNRRSAYVKYPHPASHFALIGVGVVLEMDGDTCQSARVALGGSLPKATRSPSAETVLAGTVIDHSVLAAAGDALLTDLADSIMGDIFAPEDYRKTITPVYLKRAVQAALGTDFMGL